MTDSPARPSEDPPGASWHELAERLRSIDRRGYKAYKGIAGDYAFERFLLRFDHIQGDPFADPSRITVIVNASVAALPPAALHTDRRRVSAADYLNRTLACALEQAAIVAGSGRSGELTILRPGQEVLRRTSLTVHGDGTIEARLRVGLPARGRTILGHAAVELLCDALPNAVDEALLPPNVDLAALTRHAEVVEDAQAIRSALAERNLVAFVARGAILPRRSGIDDRPLADEHVVPFRPPPSLEISIQTPNSGAVSGMGIAEGVTLLVGGGFHGKSTLLRAIQRGVYDHAPGDGRELVVSRADAVKVRAEDGRAINGTDISNFIGNLPAGEDTSRFETANASGSTSQAAAIAEALELGSRCLLIDEDTSATNFLIRDARVQALIEKAAEPITPFIDRIDDLRRKGVSLVLVVGGSGDYFDVADTVIAMRGYEPHEVTEEAHAVVRAIPTRRVQEKRDWVKLSERVPAPDEIRPRRGHREVVIKTFSTHRLTFGTAEIDLSSVEQLVERAQTRAIARSLAWSRDQCIDGRTPIAAALTCIMDRLETEGVDLIDDRRMGDYAEFRIFELGAMLNRLRKPEDGPVV